jgi:hypothetical protein
LAEDIQVPLGLSLGLGLSRLLVGGLVLGIDGRGAQDQADRRQPPPLAGGVVEDLLDLAHRLALQLRRHPAPPDGAPQQHQVTPPTDLHVSPPDPRCYASPEGLFRCFSQVFRRW